jgi:hypothetical protein
MAPFAAVAALREIERAILAKLGASGAQITDKLTFESPAAAAVAHPGKSAGGMAPVLMSPAARRLRHKPIVLLEGVEPRVPREEYQEIKRKHLLECLETLRERSKRVQLRVGMHLAEMSAAVEREFAYTEAQKLRLDREEVRL